jgi:hypothetical protein
MATMLLRTAEERFRGLVMGVRMLAIYGLPLGLLTAGMLIGRFGFQVTTSLYCVIGFAVTLLIAGYWRVEVWRRDASANAW